jgi:hypothetical protein
MLNLLKMMDEVLFDKYFLKVKCVLAPMEGKIPCFCEARTTMRIGMTAGNSSKKKASVVKLMLS